MDPLMKAFLEIQEIPAGHTLELDYERLLGVYAGSRYSPSLRDKQDLQDYQRHIRDLDDSADAILATGGYKYKILKLEFNPPDIEIMIKEDGEDKASLGKVTNSFSVFLYLVLVALATALIVTYFLTR